MREIIIATIELEYANRVMHSAVVHHLLMPSQSLSLYTDHDSIWFGISLWPAGISCPFPVYCVPQHPQRSRKVLDSGQTLLSNNKTHVLSALFSSQTQTTAPRRKINQPSPNQNTQVPDIPSCLLLSCHPSPFPSFFHDHSSLRIN